MSSEHYDTRPEGGIKLKMTPTGKASYEATTLPALFLKTVNAYGAKKAICVKRDDVWKHWTWRQYYDDCSAAAKSFIQLGLEPYHSVAIIGFNSPEWFMSDVGAIMAGGFACGIYTTNGAESCQYVCEQSRAQIVVVEDSMQLAKMLSVRDQLPGVKAFVQYLGDVAADHASDETIMDWATFMRKGEPVADHTLQDRISAQKPENCCTLIFTSGTTGKPKGVMISHDNVTWTARVTAEALKLRMGNEVGLSYLPLSHIAAQMLDIMCPMVLGGEIWFAKPDALKGSLGQTLGEVRPTYFLGVPRVWEKIQATLKAVGAQTTGIKKKIATWAKAKGNAAQHAIQEGRPTPFGYGLAKALVFKKIRKKLGLDRCRFLGTAAAPISMETLEYFLSLDMPLLEIYGMSENTGPQTVSLPGHHRSGTCGKVLEGVEMLIANPDKDGNGEICFRGRHVMMGYLNNEEKTKESIDADGWLHSGDIGKVDTDDFLKITGRIKEILITAGGENVAPVLLEDNVKEACPEISNVMVIGDKRKFLSMLVTLKCEVDIETATPKDALTPEAIAAFKGIGSDATTVTAAAKDAKVLEYLNKCRDAANENAPSRAQRIQKLTVLPVDFSIPGDELGPTLKLKRPVVYKKYAETIDALYA